jgi:hypothetical protein
MRWSTNVTLQDKVADEFRAQADKRELKEMGQECGHQFTIPSPRSGTPRASSGRDLGRTLTPTTRTISSALSVTEAG